MVAYLCMKREFRKTEAAPATVDVDERKNHCIDLIDMGRILVG